MKTLDSLTWKNSPAATTPRRILVVDDDEAMRDLISGVLTGAGFAVSTASDGQQAWESLLHKRYDLLVTDNEMPRLPGIALIERLRHPGMTLCVVVASGTAPPETVRHDPQLRIDAILPKPFDIADLLNTVNQALQVSCATDDQPELRGNPPAGHAAAREWPFRGPRDNAFPRSPLAFRAEAPQHPPGPRRILIADDDPVVRGSLAAVLESEGYLVDEARNGIETVTRSIEHAPALILLDLSMPHWDGWTTFSQLDRATPLLPVIVITARPNQYQKAVDLGVDAFMEKPLDIPVLLRAINRITSEDNTHHLRRITRKDFVTELLGGAGPSY